MVLLLSFPSHNEICIWSELLILRLYAIIFLYPYRYELSDGQIRSEEGRYKDGEDAEGNPVKILVVQGAFSWVAPGKHFNIAWCQQGINFNYL